MFAYSFLAIAAASATEGESSPMFPLLLQFAFIGAIFYFVLIVPARNKQKKLEAMVAGLKSGDRVIINPGIFGTVVNLEGEDALYVRVDDKTKIKVLRSAVAGLQDQVPETEKK
jgi:preprotein translocase subunit YajC